MSTGPTKERMEKSGDNFDEMHTDGGVTVRFTDGVIGQLSARGKLTKAQADAAEKFYNHFYLAGISQERARSIARERVDCEGGSDDSETQLHHKQKFNAALKALGHSHVGVVVGVAIDNRPLEQVGGFTGYKTRKDKITAAMDRLRNGLDELAEHFHLIPRRRRQYLYQALGYTTEVLEDLWEQDDADA